MLRQPTLAIGLGVRKATILAVGIALVIFCTRNGALAINGSDESTTRDVATGKEVHDFRVSNINSIAFSPDGKTLASAGDCGKDGTICLWNLKTGKEALRCKGHPGSVRSVAFSPDSKMLVSASNDSRIRLWNTATGKEAITVRARPYCCIRTFEAPTHFLFGLTASLVGQAKV